MVLANQPEQIIVGLAKVALQDNPTRMLTAAEVKHELFLRGHAGLFEQCDCDMLEQIDVVIANYRCEMSTSPPRVRKNDTRLVGIAPPQPVASQESSSRAKKMRTMHLAIGGTILSTRQYSGDISVPSSSDTSSDDGDTSSGDDDASGNDEPKPCVIMVHRTLPGSSTTKHRSSKNLVQCGIAAVDFEDGQWLCPAHTTSHCGLGQHCLQVTARHLVQLNSRAQVGNANAPLKELTDDMKQHVRAKYGQRAISARQSLVCGRCFKAIAKQVKRRKPKAPQTDPASSTMRIVHGRNSPWLQLARAQSSAAEMEMAWRAAEQNEAAAKLKLEQVARRAARMSDASADAMMATVARASADVAAQAEVHERCVEATRVKYEHSLKVNAQLRTQLATSRAKAHGLTEAKSMQSAAVRTRVASGVAAAVTKATATIQRKNDKLRSELQAAKASLSIETDRTHGLATAGATMRAEQEYLRISHGRDLRALKVQHRHDLREAKQAVADKEKSLREQPAVTVNSVPEPSRGRYRVAQSSGETFEELIAERTALGAGAGYRVARQTVTSEASRKPLTQRPSNARRPKDQQGHQRRNVSKKLGRRIDQMKEAAKDAGIECWPPTDVAVLQALGINTGSSETEALRQTLKSAQELHQEETKSAQELHREEIKSAQELHREEIKSAQELHREETKSAQEKHQCEIKHHDVLLARAQEQYKQREKEHQQREKEHRQQHQQQYKQVEAQLQSALLNHGSIAGSNGSTHLKLLGRASKQDAKRMGKVLQNHGVASKAYWAQMKEEKYMRFELPLVFMVLDASQCRKATCICTKGSDRIQGVMSTAQHYHLSAQQCLAFMRTTSVLDLCSDRRDRHIVTAILSYVMDSHDSTARPDMRALRYKPDLKPKAMRLDRLYESHDATLRTFASSRCSSTIAVDILEALKWNMTLVQKSARDQLFFLDEVKPGEDAAMGRGIGGAAHWCTPDVMRDCKYYEMCPYKLVEGDKSPIVYCFCFDGTRAGKDFERPIQQASWMCANLQSLSTKHVFLTHLCAVDEKQSTMGPVFESFHDQLAEPEARRCAELDRPAVYVATCDCKAVNLVLGLHGNSGTFPCFLCTMKGAHMYNLQHQRFTLHEKERKLASARGHLNRAKLTHDLKVLKSELGVSRTASMSELSAQRISKLAEVCIIQEAIDSARKASGQSNSLYLQGVLIESRHVQAASQRLAFAVVMAHRVKAACSVKISSEAVVKIMEEIKTQLTPAMLNKHSAIRRTLAHAPVSELKLRVATLMRAAGPARPSDLCSRCQPSVQNLCSRCEITETKSYIDMRDGVICAAQPYRCGLYHHLNARQTTTSRITTWY